MNIAKPTIATRLAAASIALASMIGLHPAAQAVELSRPKGVVELFTSQGCSSCPPADRMLTELARKGDTLALGWHVDYWDYIGWKDTFASPEHTARQKAYARSLAKRNIYTPQAVVNGRIDIVGSRAAAVQSTVNRLAGTSKGLSVPIDAHISDGMLRIRIENSPKARGATLWMVYYDEQRVVPVKQGENKGRELTYSNIVRDIEMIGMVRDHSLQTEFAIEDISRRGHDACALILQKKNANGDPGPIIGAAFLRDLGA